MAVPPFNIDESLPGDTDIVSQHPGNARTFREVVEDYLNTDHDPNTGGHARVMLSDRDGDTPAGVADTVQLWQEAGVLKTRNGTGAVANLADSILPTGIILMWSGSIASIPSGWALCDGNNGTPNLVDRFIVGAGDTYAVDETGGAEDHNHGGSTEAHQLTVAEMPQHTHPIPQHSNAVRTAGSDSSTPIHGRPGGLEASGNAGDNDAHAHGIDTAVHLPPFYALAYIMKL